MDGLNNEDNPQWKHVNGIFIEYTTPSRVLRSFTNLSNTVIQTALSGQSKFLFEILQNADDAYEDPNKQIEVQFILENNYFIVHHDGKGFSYDDVERICDYASQIEEVKATDLSKTGYKGLGFKSLFNLSECIYIYSNGYSFRFDKSHWSDSDNRPWQVIPIWCECLPLGGKYSYDQPVNFILKITKRDSLISQLNELVNHPELCLFLRRIHKLTINLNGKGYVLERKSERLENFKKITFFNNKRVVNTWLLGTYSRPVPSTVQHSIKGGSKFVYPDKIKKATKVPFTFSIQVDKDLQKASKIKGVCYSTLPTQLDLTLPYHTNSLFLLNLDRTQLHENEWNVYLLRQIGYLQLVLLKDLAQMPSLKDYVIQLFVRKISHHFITFCEAFTDGFKIAKNEISWLPAYKGLHLLKIGEAWIDETDFFKRNFKYIQDKEVEPYLINYDVKNQDNLLPSEAKRFTYDLLLESFQVKYHHQLSEESHKNFISYLHEKGKDRFGHDINRKLRTITFLKGKNGDILSPKNAVLEDSEPIPEFFLLNTVDNKYLYEDRVESLKDWLENLGAKRLSTPIQIIRESILKWIDSKILSQRLNTENHLQIMEYLAKNVDHLNRIEMENLRKNLLILTKGNQFKLVKDCYLCDAVGIKELDNVISDGDKISSSYNTDSLKKFFIQLGVKETLPPVDVLRKSILSWIKNNLIKSKLTLDNYYPIINYFASHYTEEIKYQLQEDEIKTLKKLPILTSSQTFQKAENCFLDTAIPKIKDLETIFQNNIITVSGHNADSVRKFFLELGVKKILRPIDVLRKSILFWIENSLIKSKITVDNYYPIINYFASHYTEMERELKPKEKAALGNMLVLTYSLTFQKAKDCYLDTAMPKVKGLENVILNDKLIKTASLSDRTKEFLFKIGVTRNIDSKIVLRLCILKWIADGVIKEKITAQNHLDILEYIAKHWENNLRGNDSLKEDEKILMRMFPVLTKNNTFREARSCYWPELFTGNGRGNKIPAIEYVISAGEFVSPIYGASYDIRRLLKSFGVKSIMFTDIYKKYSDHLNNRENQKWFFSELVRYWEENKHKKDEDNLLKFIQKKFTSSCLLAKDGKLHSAKELYSSHFRTIQKLVPDIIHLLDYDEVPKDLEDWLGFKNEIELPCMLQLLDAIDRQANLGDKETLNFFKTFLEQLKLKSKNTIKKYRFKLLSKKNKLQFASDLYYFVEEHAVCVLDSCYLKRIHDMSHNETLELASLCGVNLLSFKQEISFEEIPVYDRKFKDFYLERLPLIVLQESKELNESPIKLLKRLYIEVNSIELYQCTSILLRYPFGDPTKIRYHFQDSKIYVVHKWQNFRSPIHEFVKRSLCLVSNITEILDMDTIGEDDVKCWLSYHDEDPQNYSLVFKELQRLKSGKDETCVEELQRIMSDKDETCDEELQKLMSVQETSIEGLENLISDEEETSVEGLENLISDEEETSVEGLENLISDEEETSVEKIQKLMTDRDETRSLTRFKLLNLNITLQKSSVKSNSLIEKKKHRIDRIDLKKGKCDSSTCEELRKLMSGKDETSVEDLQKLSDKNETCDEESRNLKSEQEETCPEKLKKLMTDRDETRSLTRFKILNLNVTPQKSSAKSNSIIEKKEHGIDRTDIKKEKCDSWINAINKQKSINLNLEKLFSWEEQIGQQEDVPINDDEGNSSVKEGHSNALLTIRHSSSHTKKANHLQKLPCEMQYSSVSIEVASSASSSNWLNEKFVYTLLKKHYKNKYPNWKISVSVGVFKLRRQSSTIEVRWLNESEEKGLPYDLLLKKDEKIKQVIEVMSNDQANDSFNLINSKSTANRNQLPVDFYHQKCKYCVYRVFNKNTEAPSSSDPSNNISAVYKIVPMEI